MAELIISETLAAERLKELLEYFPETGLFRWRISPKYDIKVGSIAGTIASHGYLRIRIDGKRHQAHRLAWLYVHGVWPKDQIDHINRDRADNRIENLREASNTENSRNASKRYDNTSGHVGVVWDKKSQKWKAQIQHEGKNINLGYFTELDDAIAARAAAEIELWGRSANRITPITQTKNDQTCFSRQLPTRQPRPTDARPTQNRRCARAQSRRQACRTVAQAV